MCVDLDLIRSISPEEFHRIRASTLLFTHYWGCNRYYSTTRMLCHLLYWRYTIVFLISSGSSESPCWCLHTVRQWLSDWMRANRLKLIVIKHSINGLHPEIDREHSWIIAWQRTLLNHWWRGCSAIIRYRQPWCIFWRPARHEAARHQYMPYVLLPATSAASHSSFTATRRYSYVAACFCGLHTWLL